MGSRDILINWLNDAYAFERGLAVILNEHIKSSGDYPEIRGKLQEHLEKTKSHSVELKKNIERLGGKASELKAGASGAISWAEGKTAGLAKDHIIKNCLADYASEQMEVAAYTALIAAAEEIGDQGVIDACEKILADEEEMSAWLADQLPDLTQEFLRRQA